MSYYEETIVNLFCDCKGRGEWIRATGNTSNACQVRLFEAGWRLSNGKQICPFHVAQEERRLKSYWDGEYRRQS